MGRKILANSEVVDIQLFKDIAAATKCTINDILLCCIAGAFKKEDRNAKSIRAFSAFGAIKSGSYGIQNSAIIANYDISLDDDDVFVRLHNISNMFNQLKTSPILLGYLVAAFLICNHMPLFINKSRTLVPEGTLGVSNLLGPDLEVTVNGQIAKDVTVYPMNFGRTGELPLVFFYIYVYK